MRFPVEQRLLGRGKLFRHKAQLEERLQTVLQPGVNHPVQIGEAVPLLLFGKRRTPFLINPHLVAEKPVTADMAETAFLLYSGKLFLVFPVKRQIQPAGADTVIGQVSEGY